MAQSVTISKMEDGRFCVEAEAPGMAGKPEAGPEGSQVDMAQDKAEGEAENYCDTLDAALAKAGEMLGAADAAAPAAGKPAMDADFLAGFNGM